MKEFQYVPHMGVYMRWAGGSIEFHRPPRVDDPYPAIHRFCRGYQGPRNTEIVERVKAGEKQRDVARALGLSPSRVAQIVKRGVRENDHA